MRKIILYLLIFFTGLAVKSQDTQFSQYFSASLYLNPGFAGVYNDPTLNFNTKRQVPAGQGNIELTQVSFVFPIKPQGKLEKAIGGVGLMAYTEQQGFKGILKNTGTFLTYAHNIKFGILSSDVFSLGVQVGYESRKMGTGGLAAGSNYNPFLGYDDSLVGLSGFDNQKNNLIVNAGIMYFYNPDRDYLLYSYSAFSGFSVTNANKPNRAFVSEGAEEFAAPMVWKYNGGAELKLNKLFVIPSLLFQYTQQNYQLNAGMMFAYSPQASRYRAQGPQLILGSWYRYRDSFVVMGGIKVNSLTVRASYDLNTKLFFPTKNVEIGNQSFEVSIQYTLGGDQGIRKVSNPLF